MFYSYGLSHSIWDGISHISDYGKTKRKYGYGHKDKNRRDNNRSGKYK